MIKPESLTSDRESLANSCIQLLLCCSAVPARAWITGKTAVGIAHALLIKEPLCVFQVCFEQTVVKLEAGDINSLPDGRIVMVACKEGAGSS